MTSRLTFSRCGRLHLGTCPFPPNNHNCPSERAFNRSVIFKYCCDKLTSLPLRFEKIIFFLTKSTGTPVIRNPSLAAASRRVNPSKNAFSSSGFGHIS